MFTDISAAIEEARWLRHEEKRHFVVVQRPDGYLKVRVEKSMKQEGIKRKAYSTRFDCHMHTVLPEVR